MHHVPVRGGFIKTCDIYWEREPNHQWCAITHIHSTSVAADFLHNDALYDRLIYDCVYMAHAVSE